MKVKELIDVLQKLDGEQDIYLRERVFNEEGKEVYFDVDEVVQWSDDSGFRHYILYGGELVSG